LLNLPYANTLLPLVIVQRGKTRGKKSEDLEAEVLRMSTPQGHPKRRTTSLVIGRQGRSRSVRVDDGTQLTLALRGQESGIRTGKESDHLVKLSGVLRHGDHFLSGRLGISATG
jgi:hypothetical protein